MHLILRDKLFIFPIVLVEWHKLYKTNIERLIFGKFDEIYQFIVIEISHGYDV